MIQNSKKISRILTRIISFVSIYITCNFFCAGALSQESNIVDKKSGQFEPIQLRLLFKEKIHPEAESPEKTGEPGEIEEYKTLYDVKKAEVEPDYFAIGKKRYNLTLNECMKIAEDNHLPLTIAKKQLELAGFRLLEATRKLGPTATVKWEESWGVVYGRHYTGRKVSFEGKQPLFYGGELMYSVKQAKVNLEIVRNDYKRIKNELILQVEKTYYSLDKAKKALGIQKKLENRTGELYSMAKAGYEANVVAQIEILEISSQKNQAKFQVLSAKEDISIANLLLQQAMNVTCELKIADVGEPKIIKLSLEDCFTIAYLNRPEIKISQLSLDYFDYEKRIAKARANWPRVDLLGSYGNKVEDYVTGDISYAVPGGNPGSYIRPGVNRRQMGPEYYIGTKVTWPFWGSTLGYSLTKESWQPVVSAYHGTQSMSHLVTLDVLNKLEDISGLKEAQLEYMRALEEINKKEQEVALEVKETFFKYKKAIILMNVAQNKIEFQSKQVEIMEIRRQLGEAQYSDVAEELIKLAEEKFSYIQAITDYYIAISSLNKAVGINDYFGV